MKKEVFNFKFEEYDRQILWGHFKKQFGHEKATDFVDWLEVRCSMFVFLRDQGDRKAHRVKLQEIIDNFKQSQKYLKQIGDSFDSFPQRTIDDTSGMKAFKIMDSRNFNQLYRGDAYHSLQKMIELLEKDLNEQPLRGKLKGKTVSFIKLLADDYEKILKEKPTVGSGGHFFKFIQKLFFILNLPFTKPTNAIKQALVKNKI